VFLNRVTNAVKFNRDGGTVEVAAEPRGARIEVRVRDSGVGIPAEDLERIFDRYYRVRAAEGTSAEGYGIGLALVRTLLRLHGSSIRAESEVGRGSVFVFTLPSSGEAATEVAIEPSP